MIDDERMTLEEAASAAPGAVTFIDVRKKPDDKQIPGSIRYDQQALLDADAPTVALPRQGKVVIYCGSGNSCVRVAEHLRSIGYENAVALDGGYASWREAGLPLEDLGEQQTPPQAT